MKIGPFEIEQLSEGIFEVFKVGSFHKIDAEDITANKAGGTFNQLSTTIGIDPILIKNGKHVILLDTGLGWGLDHRSKYVNTSNLKTNLDIFELKPEDVTHVVLTHLHYDHAAGSTFVDENSTTQLSLPNAYYYLQKNEWYFAIKAFERAPKHSGERYLMDELYKLHSTGKLVLISDDYFELLPGIILIKTGGHTPGHQIVKMQSDNDVAYYLGDLVPSEYHLNNYFMQPYDEDPLQSKKAKTLILRQALKENAQLFFYHSIYAKAGRLGLDQSRNYILTGTEGNYAV